MTNAMMNRKTCSCYTPHTHQWSALSLLHGSNKSSSPLAEPHLRAFPSQPAGELPGLSKVGLSLWPTLGMTVHHCFACWSASRCKLIPSAPCTPAALMKHLNTLLLERTTLCSFSAYLFGTFANSHRITSRNFKIAQQKIDSHKKCNFSYELQH